MAALIGGGAVAVALAVVWPLYPLVETIVVGSVVVDVQNQPMYKLVLQRVAPVLLGVPLLVGRWLRNRRDPIVTAALLLLVVYLTGWATERWTLGRVLPFLIMQPQLAISAWLAQLQELGFVSFGHWRLRWSTARYVLIGCVLAALGVNHAAVVRMLPLQLLPPEIKADPRLERTADTYGVLSNVIGPDEVVAAPNTISLFVPTFAGKVVASRPHPFVADGPMRTAAMEAFFAGDPIAACRVSRTWGIDVAVVDKRRLDDFDFLLAIGRVRYEDEALSVVEIEPRCQGQ